LRFLAPYVPLPCVKFLIPLLILAAPLHAKLLATFHTTQGNVVVELQYDKTPQTVANFITLAEGTRPWVDPFTGAVRKARFYDGIKIHRTANNTVYKFAQGGSPKGDGSDGPGYTFRDEFDDSLVHVPYVLSMANAGFNTNGSQFFFTGSLPQPMYDNVHTIFGLVTDPASRAVVDSIIAAGDNATTINYVTLNRTDAASQAFDEHAQNLPLCSGIDGELQVNPGGNVLYELNTPRTAGSVFQVFRSLDLQSWVKRNETYQGTGELGVPEIILDSEILPKAFYNLPFVTYLDALAPAFDLLASRTLELTLGETETLNFQFDSGGLGGTLVYSGGQTPTAFILVTYIPEPHKAQWIMDTVYGRLGFVCGLDSENSSIIIGRNDSYKYWQPVGKPLGWYPLSSGTLTLSKP
jgi:peptidyl-prolyl cis-trans isomerase A (cyclophilin A)